MVLPFWGYFFNEPTKVAKLLKKSPYLVTLLVASFPASVTKYKRGFISLIQVKVSRCCGLKLTSEGFIVTLAKNNHHVLVLNSLFVD
jgi:hypothetical protein